MLKTKFLPAIIFLALLSPLIIKAQAELGLYEHLDQNIPDDLVFVTENHDTVNLDQFI